MALKFVENTILLFTPDPNSSLPNQQGSDGELYNELLGLLKLNFMLLKSKWATS
jgi:hypothetical protein